MFPHNQTTCLVDLSVLHFSMKDSSTIRNRTSFSLYFSAAATATATNNPSKNQELYEIIHFHLSYIKSRFDKIHCRSIENDVSHRSQIFSIACVSHAAESGIYKLVSLIGKTPSWGLIVGVASLALPLGLAVFCCVYRLCW